MGFLAATTLGVGLLFGAAKIYSLAGLVLVLAVGAPYFIAGCVAAARPRSSRPLSASMGYPDEHCTPRSRSCLPTEG
jgi:hypothetical protein